MVLGYMKAGSLRNHLEENFNNIDGKQKLHYLKQLAYNLKYIHEKDILHRDLHPGNILANDFIKCTYRLKISDFGISKLITQNSENSKERQIRGVLPYIAPEVLGGEEYTKAADVYSFGIVAYEVFTGIPPFRDVPHDRHLELQICNGLRPKIPFHIPKSITKIIMQCWDARVDHRPTFEELWKQLSCFEQGKSKKIRKRIKSKLKLPTTPSKNYRTHPGAIYSSRLLSCYSLPKPKNEESFEKNLEELTKSTFMGKPQLYFAILFYFILNITYFLI